MGEAFPFVSPFEKAAAPARRILPCSSRTMEIVGREVRIVRASGLRPFDSSSTVSASSICRWETR